MGSIIIPDTATGRLGFCPLDNSHIIRLESITTRVELTKKLLIKFNGVKETSSETITTRSDNVAMATNALKQAPKILAINKTDLETGSVKRVSIFHRAYEEL